MLSATIAEMDFRELPRVSWRPPQATYLAWLDCTNLGLGEEPAQVFLRDGGIALGRGLDYGPQVRAPVVVRRVRTRQARAGNYDRGASTI